MSRRRVVASGPTRRCERCSCTEQSACPGGCAWVPTYLAADRYVCTSCVGPADRPAPAPVVRPIARMHGYLDPKTVAKLMRRGRGPTLAELLALFKSQYGDRSLELTLELPVDVPLVVED